MGWLLIPLAKLLLKSTYVETVLASMSQIFAVLSADALRRCLLSALHDNWHNEPTVFTVSWSWITLNIIFYITFSTNVVMDILSCSIHGNYSNQPKQAMQCFRIKLRPCSNISSGACTVYKRTCLQPKRLCKLQGICNSNDFTLTVHMSCRNPVVYSLRTRLPCELCHHPEYRFPLLSYHCKGKSTKKYFF